MVNYLLRMMTSWAIVVNVWYLPPMTRRVGCHTVYAVLLPATPSHDQQIGLDVVFSSQTLTECTHLLHPWPRTYIRPLKDLSICLLIISLFIAALDRKGKMLPSLPTE